MTSRINEVRNEEPISGYNYYKLIKNKFLHKLFNGVLFSNKKCALYFKKCNFVFVS